MESTVAMTPIFAQRPMSFPHFIARRILSDKDRQDRLSRPIVAIAVLGILIGMAVMILTIGISTGFQREVRAKVTGAGAHIEIVPLAQYDAKDSQRVPIDQPFYPSLDTVQGVRHIQVFTLKPGIVETANDIQGVVVKGVGKDHDWTFLQRMMVAGDVLQVGDTTYPTAVISQWLARRLRQNVGDTVTIYLIRGREDMRPRRFKVKGIYETGLEKIDHQLVYVDIAHLQRFSQWGLRAEIRVSTEALNKGSAVLEGLAYGGQGDHHFEWPGTQLSGPGPFTICLRGDTTFTLVVHDGSGTVPDTAWATITAGPANSAPCRPFGSLTYRTSGGSASRYCGGFEVALNDHRDLRELDDRIYRDHLGEGMRTITVREKFPEIFAWLELLDTNVVVVIVLMVLVAIINMTSALLIIILERTNMIGVLKALGGTDGMIQRVFLIDAAYILGVGILLGDVLGIGLALVQQRFQIVRLPIESYYVDSVPVDLSLMPIALLNLGVMVACVLALVIPSMYVARIAPAKAIRFD
jgi:lipoprotein-releasing system permease protein